MKQGEIGFDRRLKREWLDVTASLASSGADIQTIRQRLDELLSSSVAESGMRGARSKTITVLCRLWVSHNNGLREDARKLFAQGSDLERPALHWGLAMVTYPFFFDVVSIIGRLLNLQMETSLSEITRRTKEKWGDRERVARSARHVVQSVRDWGMLRSEGKKGIYRATAPMKLTNDRLIGWLIEATLRASGAEMGSLQRLLQSPSLFPFSMPAFVQREWVSPRVEFSSEGLDERTIVIR
jgi:hypothetical protein